MGKFGVTLSIHVCHALAGAGEISATCWGNAFVSPFRLVKQNNAEFVYVILEHLFTRYCHISFVENQSNSRRMIPRSLLSYRGLCEQ